MAIVVVGTHADQRDARVERVEQRLGGRRAAAVVCDLQDVELRSQPPRESSGEQLRIDLFLGIAREEHVACTKVQLEYDRRVVDVLAAARWVTWHLAGERPLDVEPRPVKPQPVAGRDHPRRATLGRQLSPVSGVTGAGPKHAVLDHLADLVSRQQQRQARDMVLVRVCQHNDIEPAVPCWDALVEEREQAVGIGAGIDQHPATAWALKKNGVTLTNVEHRHVQPTVRLAAADQHEQHAQAD